MADQNHVVDPTWFDDALAEFTFDYVWFARCKKVVDELGRVSHKYDKLTIKGSLQPKTSEIVFNNTGANREQMMYDFYCKSLYRIDVGDFIYYQNKYLYVEGKDPYDEYGVRHVSLKMVNIAQYKDFQEYIKYLKGDKIV